MSIDDGFDGARPNDVITFADVDSEFDPSILPDSARDSLNTLYLTDEQVALFGKQVRNDETFANPHALFANLRIQEQQNGDQTQTVLLSDVNPEAVPFQRRYIDEWGRTRENIPGARAFVDAERETGGDSSLFGLVAASVGDEQGRQRLYHEVSRVLTEAVGQMDLEELGERLQAVYGPEGNDLVNLSPASLVRIHRGGAGLFLNADFHVAYQHLVDSGNTQSADALRQEVNGVYQVTWAKQIKDLAEGVKKDLQEDQPTTLQRAKDIELLSHLFDAEKVIALVSDPDAAGKVESEQVQPANGFKYLLERLDSLKEKLETEAEEGLGSVSDLGRVMSWVGYVSGDIESIAKILAEHSSKRASESGFDLDENTSIIVKRPFS